MQKGSVKRNSDQGLNDPTVGAHEDIGFFNYGAAGAALVASVNRCRSVCPQPPP